MGRAGCALLLAAIFVCAGGPALAAQPKASVEGSLDRALRAEIEHAVGVVKAPAESRFEARRRAREAAADAVALLRSEGYYLADVVADVSAGEPPRALVTIDPGPRFSLAASGISWRGAAPDPQAAAAALRAVALDPGKPGRAADILAAEGRAVAAVQKLGYADAVAAPRRVVVDDAAHTVQPTFVIDSGARVRLDGMRIVGDGRTRAAWLERLAPWRRGAVYDPRKVARLERLLRETGVYDSVTVALAPPAQGVDGLRPVIVSLADRKANTLELEAAYSAGEVYTFDPTTITAGVGDQGSGIQGKFITYDRLRRADTITLTARLYDIEQKLDLEADLPDLGRPDQILKVGGGVLADDTPAFKDVDANLRFGIERHFTKTSFVSLGGALDETGTREETAVNLLATPVGENLKLFIVTGLAGLALDRSDNPLNPTRGWKLQLRVEPTDITGDRSLAYLKTDAQASAYAPLGARAATVIAVRLRLGSILGGAIPDVPADRRFYGGGGGSVRGYAYQAVGPRLSDNTPAGGLSVFEGSLEVRQRLSDAWGLVAFVDTGSVGEGPAPQFTSLSTGVGLGLRYNLGFAPLRVDIATPLDPRKGDAPVEVYVSIGQSF